MQHIHASVYVRDSLFGVFSPFSQINRSKPYTMALSFMSEATLVCSGHPYKFKDNHFAIQTILSYLTSLTAFCLLWFCPGHSEHVDDANLVTLRSVLKHKV